MTPVPVNVPEASLEWSVLPGIGIVPSGAAVTLNVLVPVANSVGGFGVACAFLKKNAPNKSPQLSLNKSILLTVATAPLLSPTIFAPLLIYPKYCASFASDIVSTFNILEVAEYESDGAGLVVSKGSTVYDSTKTDGLPNPAPTSGLDVSPNL